MVQLDYDQDIKKVLEMIKNKTISPKEGFLKIEELKAKKASKQNQAMNGVAVIGISGRFPGSNDVNEFWDNLIKGKSSITEVPKDRWDIEEYFDTDVMKLDKTNSRWGGFLSDIDKFDPLFFGISGAEAEVTDPQQRLFLEECWKALEEAGYANDEISGVKCGVYVGAAPRDYLNQLQDKGLPITAQAFWGNTGSVLASRISYLLNLKGPAFTVDTACSSSLVATHLACQGILDKEVDMAIAGGVWIATTPHYYVMTSNAGMLSPNGKCNTFDNSANGIVNGEGVGAVILKALDKAIEDGDYIYGVIKSSGINQDGKTNGITAPSSLSQTELELEVYRKGNINPETITFIEAHGTGTKLGDPIEVEALINSFKKHTNKQNFCALGSVKTNIGHSAMSAGIISLIKVMLTLKNKKIPPSLNFKNKNEYIDMDGSPFYVNTELKDWVVKDGPRRAGVSSFGFSGTNAHMVIEEFEDRRKSKTAMPLNIVAFSAKTPQRLEQRLADFLAWSESSFDEFSVGDICNTLNNCRKHFSSRIAFVFSGKDDLNKKIQAVLGGKEANKFASVELSKEEMLNKNKALQEMLIELKNASLTKEKLEEILLFTADFYNNGGNTEWHKLYNKSEYLKVPLPTYPFAKESYWVTDKADKKTTEECFKKLHPLIDENVSSFNEQKFKTSLSASYTLAKDCKLKGQEFFPTANYLEMALAAGEISWEKKVKSIEEAVSLRPILYKDSEQQLKTCLYPDDDCCYAEISLITEAEEKVFAQAKIIYEDEMVDYSIPNIADIVAIKKQFDRTMVKEQYYKFLTDKFKLEYGQNYQVINKVLLNSSSTEGLAEIAIPDSMKNDKDSFLLNPAFMEGVFQASLGLIPSNTSKGICYFSGFERLEIHNPLAEKCFINTILSKSDSLNSWQFTVRIINWDGTVALTIDNYSIKGF